MFTRCNKNMRCASKSCCVIDCCKKIEIIQLSCDSMQQSHVAQISLFTQHNFVARRMSHVFVALCKRAFTLWVPAARVYNFTFKYVYIYFQILPNSLMFASGHINTGGHFLFSIYIYIYRWWTKKNFWCDQCWYFRFHFRRYRTYF